MGVSEAGITRDVSDVVHAAAGCAHGAATILASAPPLTGEGNVSAAWADWCSRVDQWARSRAERAHAVEVFMQHLRDTDAENASQIRRCGAGWLQL
ncbi:hypothetical protein IEU95_04965 [Hoyosella rhizosphaerae]|uniref:Uncharacterized protein n=1 Tax=Hoyosella rhizosphaerae TaxID=1755582 RepID=A0A916U985_9ACTN|nr:hypothetical protein [Hoyosella rhizosphaerae]MBN4926169.1 hypothetical protein [Hoyosella rhizosphaerae]GGC64974.1 hypothetical protein GCM10011410_16840 [Hoyosella rhizosphaerae]